MDVILSFFLNGVHYKFKNSKRMKSVSKKQKHADKSPLHRKEFGNQQEIHRTQQSIVQQQFRRYSEMPTQQALPHPKLQPNRYSRITNIKSQHPSRNRSLTPGSQASSMYLTQCQNRYKQLQQIMARQNENITQQNIFLQQQIKNLYERQAKHKSTIKRYKEQIKFLKLQNEIYQQRYTEIKTYINSVVERMAQLTVMSQDQDRELFRNSSLEMVAKLKEELSHYEDYNEGQAEKQSTTQVPLVSTFYQADNRNVQSQCFVQNYKKEYAEDDRQDVTNNFIHTQDDIQQINDLQETRFIKEPVKYHHSNKPQYNDINKKKLHKLPTFCKHSQPNHISRQSEQSHRHSRTSQNQYPAQIGYSKQSSTPNSDSKTIDNHYLKTKNLLQDTSESNCQPGITQQIEQLTDQSQALMYELQKTNNQDSDIKKKIIRISQKIRQLKMEATSIGEHHNNKFTSLQNINPVKRQ